MEHIFKDKIKIKKRIYLNIAVIFIVLFLLTLFFSSGCSSRTDIKTLVKNKLTSEDDMNIAVSIVENFFNYLKSEEYDKAYELLSAKDKDKHDFTEFEEELKNVTRIVEVEINWVEVKNNIANVGIDLIDIYDDEEKVYKDLIISLIKDEDGSWGINFWN